MKSCDRERERERCITWTQTAFTNVEILAIAGIEPEPRAQQIIFLGDLDIAAHSCLELLVKIHYIKLAINCP